MRFSRVLHLPTSNIFSTITGVSGSRESMVTGGLIGLMGGFVYAYQNSAGRLKGFFPNEGEVATHQKHKRGGGSFN